jgi:o-succinylbenzoate---CoA ligase
MHIAEKVYSWLAMDLGTESRNEHRSALIPWIEKRTQEIADRPYHQIDTANPIEFLVEFWAAVLSNKSVLIHNPQWGKKEQQQLQQLLEQEPLSQPGQILIPTGGTSGELKFAIHTPETLSAAVAGFQEFYGVTEINSYCILPLHHVSGLMQLWRSSTTNGRLIIAPEPQPVPSQEFFISLVPTQLQRWLEVRRDWLQSFRAVMIGGAPLAQELADRARSLQIPLSPCYGCTETAAMVTAMPPADFLAGHFSSGLPLPHVQIEIDGDGRIQIQSPALMEGYYPTAANAQQAFDDLGAIDDRGHLQVLGRASQKIISGGEKIFPNEVEAVILATGLVADVCVIGWPDADWGEKVVALYVPLDPVDISVLKGAIANQLSKFKQPKNWLTVSVIPRNSQGKLERHVLLDLIAKYLEP